MLIFVKSKNNYFLNFFATYFLNFLKILPYTITIKAVLRIRKNMRIHGSESKEQNINQKLKNWWTISEITWIRIHFFQYGSRNRIRIRIKFKWIISTALKLEV